MFEDSDSFLAAQAKDNPEKFQEVSERYPVLSKRDYYRIQLGEPISRASKRRKDTLTDAERPVPKEKKKNFSPEDYEDYRNNKSTYEREWLEDYYRAKELADQGM